MSDDYFDLNLPIAPAVIVGDELVIEGIDIDEIKIEEAICRHLGLSPPD